MAFVATGLDGHLGAAEFALAEERSGAAAVLFEGEPGIGKSALWTECIRRAEEAGHLVLSCRASLSAARLAFSVLSDLLVAIPEADLGALPGPQSAALRAALLTSAVQSPTDPRTIGTALVSLVNRLAGTRRVVFGIDDIQWIDRSSARALEFAFRRLAVSRIVFIGSTRSSAHVSPAALGIDAWADIQDRQLRPMNAEMMREIVGPLLPEAMSRSSAARLCSTAKGNPLVALEIVRSLQRESPTAGLWVSGTAGVPVPQAIREVVDRRLRELPAGVRAQLLLLAAGDRAEATADVSMLGHAVRSGLLFQGSTGRFEFAHPLYEAAIYAASTDEQRRVAHRQLARQVEGPEAHARHLALATEGPSEEIADALEAAAEHALFRGAVDHAADLFELAAKRTPSDEFETRLSRTLRAADVHFLLVDIAEVSRLVTAVIDANPTPDLGAQARLLLAETVGMSDPDRTVSLLESALAMATGARTRAKILVSLGSVHQYHRDLAKGLLMFEEAVSVAEAVGHDHLLAQALSNRESTRFTLGLGADRDALDRALHLEDPAGRNHFDSRPSIAVAHVFQLTGGHGRSLEILTTLIARQRGLGEELELPLLLNQRAAASLFAGDLSSAHADATSAIALAERFDQLTTLPMALSLRAVVSAIRGDRAPALDDCARGAESPASVEGRWSDVCIDWAKALMALVDDNAGAASALLERHAAALEDRSVYEMTFVPFAPDAIESWVAVGDIARAATFSDKLLEHGQRLDRQWARAVALRGKAMIASVDGSFDDALRLGEAAINEHAGLSMAWEEGRTLLVVGRIRRRAGQRRLASEALETAIEIFTRIGAQPWLAKASSELARIGVRRAPSALTENERRVCELAAAGESNPSIAARLFVSVRTVEAHLSRSYSKLGIANRAQLGVALARVLDA